MSEYWKSTPKYWCKHCSTYVKDTSLERKQHESTGKHQGNLRRFLRDIQNGHERAERDKLRAKAEVDRLKGTFGSSSSDPKDSSNSVEQAGLPTSRKSAPTPPSAADQKRQWAQLADLGIKVPEQGRSEMAMAGDWSVVSNEAISTVRPREKPLSVGVKKRKLEGQEDEAAGEGGIFVGRGWGSTTKQFPGHDNADLDDLLSGSVTMVKKDKHEYDGHYSETSTARAVEKQDEQAAQKRVGSQSIHTDSDQASEAVKGEDNPSIKKEESHGALADPTRDNIPEETPIPVFKRRKAKAP